MKFLRHKPQAKWLQSLYQDGKMSAERFLQLSASLFPLGHAARKRDIEEVLRDRRHREVEALVATEKKALEEAAPLEDLQLAAFPEAEEFVNGFKESRHRRPIFLLVGPTYTGKSLLAGHLLSKIAAILQVAGYVEVTVENDGYLDFSSFDVTRHGGVLLDGIGDVLLLKANREALQGRPKLLLGGRSQTMRYAYPYALARRAVVATADLGAANLHLLSSDHWLSDPRNVRVLRLDAPASALLAQGAPLAALSPEEKMRTWSVAEVVSFLKSNDLDGPANVVFTHGVRGQDLLTLDFNDLVDDLRLSRFSAGRILAATRAFLRSAA